MASESNLRQAVSDGLVARGFRRVGRTHISRVNGDWSLWVDTGPLGKRADITPFVGIRNDRVEELFADLLGVARDKYVGTVGANVGYLIKGEQFRTWSPPTPAAEVLTTIEQALGRFRPYLDLQRLPEAWRLPGTSDPGKLYRLVVVPLLLGDRPRMAKALDAARATFCKNEGEVCEQFRAFEVRTMRSLDERV